MNVSAPWVPLLREAGLSRSAKSLTCFTFCTISKDLLPKARTCVFRGWLFDDPATGVLQFTTDTRMTKADEIRHNDQFEACFYFPETKLQFRISGFCQILSRSNTPSLAPKLLKSTPSSTFYPIYSPSYDCNSTAELQKFPVPSRKEWDSEYDRVWDLMSPGMKSSFKKPPPGAVLDTQARKQLDSISRGADGLSEEDGKENFVVMLMFPSKVDMVNISDVGHRTIFSRSDFNEWTEQEVCP